MNQFKSYQQSYISFCLQTPESHPTNQDPTNCNTTYLLNHYYYHFILCFICKIFAIHVTPLKNKILLNHLYPTINLQRYELLHNILCHFQNKNEIIWHCDEVQWNQMVCIDIRCNIFMCRKYTPSFHRYIVLTSRQIKSKVIDAPHKLFPPIIQCTSCIFFSVSACWDYPHLQKIQLDNPILVCHGKWNDEVEVKIHLFVLDSTMNWPPPPDKIRPYYVRWKDTKDTVGR